MVGMIGGLYCDADKVWEIDINPPEDWHFPQQIEEDMILLACESPKKRVEVKFKDVTVRAGSEEVCCSLG